MKLDVNIFRAWESLKFLFVGVDFFDVFKEFHFKCLPRGSQIRDTQRVPQSCSQCGLQCLIRIANQGI